MKLLLLAILLALPALAQTPLTNADVLTLLRAGIGPEVVAAKIRQTGGAFDTSPVALRALQEAHVPAVVLVAMVEAARPAPAALRLPARTPVQIETASAVSSADLKSGDLVSFRVAAPVVVGNVVAIEAGALATARVVEAKGGRAWARGGLLTWALQDVVAVDQQRIPLSADGRQQGDARASTMTVGIIVTALVFWPAAPLWGFKHGKPAVVPAGTRYEVFTGADATIDAAARPRTEPPPALVAPGPAARTCLFGGKPIPCR